MRPVEFRVWDKKRQKMESCVSVSPFGITDCDRRLWKPDEVELMQYTGLCDRNGKKVFEGDIVKGIAIQREGGFEYFGKVVWYGFNTVIGWYVEDAEGRGWELRQLQTRISLDHITGEVIGNIWESPRLLKEVQ